MVHIAKSDKNRNLDYNNVKASDSIHDLTNGDKQYLKGHGITSTDFDKLDNVSKMEWMNECRDNAYQTSYDKNLARGRSTTIVMGEGISQERWDQIFNKSKV